MPTDGDNLPACRRPLRCAADWHGAQMADSQRWRRRLSDAHIAELDTALASAQRAGLDWQAICPENFPLPGWKPLLADIAHELEQGTGLCNLSGLPAARYSRDDLRRAWMGIAAHLGRPLHQDAYGLLMRDICDEGADVGTRFGAQDTGGGTFLSSRARALSNAPLRFHTDRADVVGLLCVSQGARGGGSRIASTVAVHNTMLERRPDLLDLLYQPFYRSRLGEERGGQWCVYALPVFGVRDGKLTSHYSRTYIEAAQQLPGVPRMRPEQWQALDLLAELAEECCFRMMFEPGDIQLLNNHVVYHARDAFEDDPASGRQRRLMRLWLAMPDSRALPDDHAVLWRDVSAGALRGGIGLAREAGRVPAA